MDTTSSTGTSYLINSALHITQDGGQARPSNSNQVNSILGSDTLTFIFRIFFEDTYVLSNGKYLIMCSIGEEKAPNGNPLGFSMYVEKGSYGAYLNFGDCNRHQLFKIPVNEWIDCAIVLDIPKNRFYPYINGELYNVPLGWGGPNLTGKSDIVIGSRPNTPWMNFKPFPGYIQYISIFNRTLDKQSVIDYTTKRSLDIEGLICTYSFQNGSAILQNGISSVIKNNVLNVPIPLTTEAKIIPIETGTYRESQNKQKIDLTNPNITSSLKVTEANKFFYNQNYKSWFISHSNSDLKLEFELNEVQDIYFILETCHISDYDTSINILVNDQLFEQEFHPFGRTPNNESWKIQSSYLKAGINHIQLRSTLRDSSFETDSVGTLVRYASIVLSKKEYYTIDFTNSNGYNNILSFSSIVGKYRDDLKSWSLFYSGSSYAKFNLFLSNKPSQKKVKIGFTLCSGLKSGVTNCPVDILINNNVILSNFDPHSIGFYDFECPVDSSILKQGDNLITIRLCSSASTCVFIASIFCKVADIPNRGENWMSFINDNTSIGKINIPGTHDSAAINSSVHTPWACHYTSITEQLIGGVRLFDIRLKVKKDSCNNYYFVTCHGDFGSFFELNEYAPFKSVMDEFIEFLEMHNTETIIMSLKMDDWNGFNDKVKIYCALKCVLDSYNPFIYKSSSLPSLGSVRGKIFVFNRMSDNNNAGIGCTIDWKDNTDGSNAFQHSSRNFSVFVQDKYTDISTGCNKFEAFYHALKSYNSNDVLINFASGTMLGGIAGIYIHDTILYYFGKLSASERPNFGWTFMDYEFEKYYTSTYGQIDLVKFIIDSNVGYVTYPEKFTINGVVECNI